MRVTRGPVDCDLPRQSGWTPEVRKEGETLGYCSKEHMYGGQKAKVSEPQRWQRIVAVGQRPRVGDLKGEFLRKCVARR